MTLGILDFKIEKVVKRLLLGLVIILSVLFFLYLFHPPPPYLTPLPNSVESTEPGDTVQISGVSAYYSQHQRAFVTKYYQEKFDEIPGLPIEFPSYRLNHPPQFAHEKIRSQVLSSYFEEVVHPFRESLFINGWEPEVFLRGNPGAISQHAVIVDGVKYFSKTTLRPFYSTLPARIISFVGILISCAILYFLTRRIVFGRI